MTAAVALLPTVASAQSPIEFFLQEAARNLQSAFQAPASAGWPAYEGRQSYGGSTMVASWYGGGERLARRTASGAVFRPGGRTVAHRSLPFGTRLLVSYRGRSAVCVVNDRGPSLRSGRSIDLARGCALAIGMTGVARIHVARV